MIFDENFIEELDELIKRKDLNSIERFIQKPNRKRCNKSFFRSALMVPGYKPKYLNKLDSLIADIAVINLEDGVSKELKPVALRVVALFLSYLKRSNSLIVVRVNPLDFGGKEEIEFLNQFKPDAIRVPKIKSTKDVKEALELIDEDIDLHLSIETKEAFLNLKELKVDSRVKAYYLGVLDLLNDLDIPQNILKVSNPTINYILSSFLIISKASNVLPISFVYQDYKNLEEFKNWCKYEKDMGFSAKGCISVKQAKIANEIFSISYEILQKAKYIKDIFEKMQKRGVTGFVDEKYGFIDEPIYKDALKILGKKDV